MKYLHTIPDRYNFVNHKIDSSVRFLPMNTWPGTVRLQTKNTKTNIIKIKIYQSIQTAWTNLIMTSYNTWIMKTFFFVYRSGADPYLVISCEGSIVQSTVKKDTLNPLFDTRAIFYRKKPRKPITVQVGMFYAVIQKNI